MKNSNDLDLFPKPSVTVDAVVFGYDLEQLYILLNRRKNEPFLDAWALPGGFLRMEESFEMAIERVLQEKTSLQNVFLEQLYTFGTLNRDPRGRVLSVAYFALVNPKNYKIAQDHPSADAAWMPLNEIPDLAFDHAAVLETALSRLRGKLSYQPVGFELLETEFTLSELQKVYETILDTKIDRRNFRKKMLALEIIIATGKKRDGTPNRRPDIYIFNQKRYKELEKAGLTLDLKF